MQNKNISILLRKREIIRTVLLQHTVEAKLEKIYVGPRKEKSKCERGPCPESPLSNLIKKGIEGNVFFIHDIKEIKQNYNLLYLQVS
jgi:hypothetical protein